MFGTKFKLSEDTVIESDINFRIIHYVTVIYDCLQTLQ